jgi:D-alanyl-D-alanine carboxypeptidase/D-alanyl-D-alanine-endopeptidase (penicillin-binding protein 4)
MSSERRPWRLWDRKRLKAKGTSVKRNLARRRRTICSRDRARSGSPVRCPWLRVAGAIVALVAALSADGVAARASEGADADRGASPARIRAAFGSDRTPPQPAESVATASPQNEAGPALLPPGRLARKLDAVLAGAPKGTKIGVSVMSARTGAALYARNADEGLIPASNVKVFTIAAALDALGADYVFRTEALAAGSIADGVLRGSLVLRGSGDPSLTTEGLWGLVLDLEAAGLRRVEGDLILDATAFDDVQPRAAGPGRYQGRPYGALTSALTSNFNTIAVEIRPGVKRGDPARVATVPPLSGIRIRNQVRTSPGGGLEVRVREGADGAPALVVVSGRIAPGSAGRRVWRSVGRPDRLTGRLFKELLSRADISIGGQSRPGSAPPGARVIALRKSPPLSVLLREVGKRSSNLYAEQILKALSATRPRSTRAGLERVRRWASERAIGTGSFRLEDGSGLSRLNRVTASQIARALRAAGNDPRTGPEYRASFAVAGVDGTLRRRLVDLRGRVRGKTGHLSGVDALSGWAHTDRGEEAVFAILVNGSDGEARALQDRIVRVIVAEG